MPYKLVDPKRVVRRITGYAGRNSASTVTEALRLATGGRRKPSSRDGETKPNVYPFPAQSGRS